MEHLKILIVDDDPTTCTLLETTLEMEGYQASSAHSIENDDVLFLLNNEKPDILFLDFHLGSGDALQYMIAIRNDVAWQHLPVLMTSAIDRSQECLAAGANSFILKPFDWDGITNTIDEVRGQILNREET